MLKKLTVLAVGWGLSLSALAVDVATLIKQAESGNISSQEKLADYYRRIQDHEKESYWTEKLANLGNVVAQFNIGVNYENGKGVDQDYTKAIEWYQKSANQGYADAQFNLGGMFRGGKGVKTC